MSIREALTDKLKIEDIWVRKLISTRYINHTGCDYDRDSMRDFIITAGYNGDDEFIPQTFQPLIDRLYDEVKKHPKATVHLNTVVNRVNSEEKETSVTTADGKSYEGDYIICTAPLGVLKQNTIQFNPALSPEKQNAISHLEMAVMNNVVMEFDKCFWDKSNTHIMLAHENPDYVPLCLNLNIAYPESNVLILSFYGKEACQSEEQLIKTALGLLKNCFKEKMSTPKTMLATQWHCDANFYGSWSIGGKNTTGQDRLALSLPERSLLFAGEHVLNGLNSTLHSALVSGRLAVKSALVLVAAKEQQQKTQRSGEAIVSSATVLFPTQRVEGNNLAPAGAIANNNAKKFELR